MRLLAPFLIGIAFPAIASAQLRFSQPHVDLGELRGGLVHSHRFGFTVDGPGPVEIVDVRLGCGCLSPDYEKRVYESGEKGSIAMQVRTLGQSNGPRTWQAQVQYRQAGKIHETSLVLGAMIRNEISIEPSILAMTVEAVLQQEVKVTDHRARRLKVTSVIPTSDAIEAKARPGEDGVTIIQITVRGAALSKVRQEEMLNIYTDDPYYRHLQIPVTLSKASPAAIQASPPRAELRGAGSQLVRLRSTGEKNVRVEKIDVDHPGIRCTWAAGPGNDATLRISTMPGMEKADLRSTVRVHVSGTIITIPVVVQGE